MFFLIQKLFNHLYLKINKQNKIIYVPLKLNKISLFLRNRKRNYVSDMFLKTKQNQWNEFLPSTSLSRFFRGPIQFPSPSTIP